MITSGLYVSGTCYVPGILDTGSHNSFIPSNNCLVDAVITFALETRNQETENTKNSNLPNII